LGSSSIGGWPWTAMRNRHSNLCLRAVLKQSSRNPAPRGCSFSRSGYRRGFSLTWVSDVICRTEVF
jgi:hypothetical protein